MVQELVKGLRQLISPTAADAFALDKAADLFTSRLQ
jgi:hypothetical protein